MMQRAAPRFSLVLASLFSFIFLTWQAHAEKRHGVAMHGLSMHGNLKYAADFKHFDYVNPSAPKGGTLRLGVVGDNFDSFNPFIIKGSAAAGTNYLYQSLTEHSEDEAFSEYGLIAEAIDMPKERSSVTFYLNKKAHFSDGKPITADDVIYSFNTLTKHEKSSPFYSAYYADVDKVEALDPHTVKFTFKTDQNKELPLILGQIPVLAKHYWEANDFGTASLKVPVGNGPYKIKSFEPGRSITLVRDDKYWAKDLPVNVGRYNFDEIIFEYYKDGTIALQAFKAGEFDFRVENTARNWANSYVGPKFESGELIKTEIKHERPAGMQSFAFNLRRPQFQDPRVRRALAYAFDFEWTNQNLFNSQYQRNSSYFENTELASSGLPSKEELVILEPFRNQLPKELFTDAYAVPSTKEPNNLRKNLRTATQLLKDAGWEIKDKALRNKDGKAFEFEFLLVIQEFERVILPFVQNLEKLGIKANIRLVDTSQYTNRMREFDFDMTIASFGQSNSPGNEQRDYWHSTKTKEKGSRNVIGIENPVIDTLIEQIINAPDRQALIHRTRALDRVLLWNHYVIPNWFIPYDRVAYSKKLMRPDVTPKSGVDTDTWWVVPTK